MSDEIARENRRRKFVDQVSKIPPDLRERAQISDYGKSITLRPDYSQRQ